MAEENNNNEENEEIEENENNNNNNEENETSLQELNKQVDQMKKQHQKELDRYRNEKGQLKKQVDELKDEKLSDKEKLEKEKGQLEDEKQQLKADRLDAHKEKVVAKEGLDPRLAKYANINHDMEQDDVERKVEDLKSIQNALKDEFLKDLEQKGKVINTNNNKNNNNEGNLGKSLAERNSQSNEEAEKGQEHYFENNK